MQREFSSSDAWLLVALMVAKHPARLEDLIATADGINHAIPTTAEINGALNRLHAAGLLSARDEHFVPSSAARELFERISSGRHSLLGVVDRVHQALMRESTASSIPDHFAYTDADVHTACEAYRQRLA